MYAIAWICGKQYRVAEGDTVVVDRMAGDEGQTVILDRVLLTNDGKTTQIGKPTVKGVSVKAKIVSQGKGKKVEVRRFKAKVRYRRHIGFRPQQTVLEILSIEKA